MDSRERWKEIYRRFDPKRAVGVEYPKWRADRAYSPIQEIQAELQIDREIGDPWNRPRILLLGTPGTGKTTELRRLGDEQSGNDFVLILDLVRLFEQVATNPAGLERVSAWEICYLVGLSLYQAAQERLSLPWDERVLPGLEAAWRAAAGKSGSDAPQGELQLGKLAGAVFQGASLLLDGGAVLGAAAKLVESAAGAVNWNLPLGKARQALPDDLAESRALIDQVNRIIGEIQHRHHRILLIIDGLDRIGSIERARSLFVESRLLSQFACPVVICGPFILRHHPAVAAVQGGFKTFPLVNEPVVQREKPEELGQGYAFLRELFERRVQDLCEPDGVDLVPDALLRKLAYYSGGRARDFVRLLGEVAGRVLLAGQPAATEQVVDWAIDRERRSREMGLYDVHLTVLRGVRDDPSHTLPQHDATWTLLETFRLLPYPNEHEWFYPHTLLLKRLG